MHVHSAWPPQRGYELCFRASLPCAFPSLLAQFGCNARIGRPCNTNSPTKSFSQYAVLRSSTRKPSHA